MMNWISLRRIGAAAVAIVTVLALAVAVSLVGSLYRGLTGPAAPELVALQPGAPDTPGAAQSSGTPSLAPSAVSEPGASWSTAFSVPPGPYSRLDGIAEAGGALFALGRSDRSHPAIWFSRDGSTWTAAEVPVVTERLDGADGSSGELTAIVRDVEDAGDRLVALATVGLADGSGPIGTMLYVSDDTGQTWSRAQSTPGSATGAMFDLVLRGDRLFAVGTAIWASDDGGLNWSQVVDAESLGGTLHAVDVRGDLIVAAGEGGNGDITSPPAIVMVSTDGDRWERRVLDPDAVAHAMSIGEGGRIIVAGHVGAEVRIWVSDDVGDSWSVTRPPVACCVTDLVASPDGYVAALSGPFDGVLVSTDGLTWSARALGGSPEVIDWGPVFGLVGTRDDAALLGPVPAP